ncbi:MAG: S-methyl-5-thioribose-1-phosphate isomerase [Lacipirellulaceae bacterium]
MPLPPTSPITWQGPADSGLLSLLDQTRLPSEVVRVDCRTVEDVWRAIKRLAVRGAPAIGIAAAYGVVLGTRGAADVTTAKAAALAACDHLATSRPTAVNLFWALDRVRGAIGASAATTAGALADELLGAARAIHDEDREQCAAIGRHGAALLGASQGGQWPLGGGVLTHCNTGALATGGDGTALAVVFALHAAGRAPKVYADETRPLLQGARLTAWECHERGVDVTLLCDSMAATLLRDRRVQAVIVGADRIASNGDAANKIGTYGLAVLARHHGVPFYVAAPTTTFDLSIESGADIPIEQRAAEEVTEAFGKRTAPAGVAVYNPAFDVAPAGLITAIVTERGVIAPVTRENVLRLAGDASGATTSPR